MSQLSLITLKNVGTTQLLQAVSETVLLLIVVIVISLLVIAGKVYILLVRLYH